MERYTDRQEVPTPEAVTGVGPGGLEADECGVRGDQEMAERVDSRAILRAPIAAPANRKEYLEWRINRSLDRLPAAIREQAKPVVTNSIRMEFEQRGIVLDD